MATAAQSTLLSTTGSYRTVAELGRGGMGTVFLALVEGAGGFERLVAVKRMHPHPVTSQQAIDRFLNEARLAAHVHHANVVGIQQVGSDGKNYFLVLDYVDGEGLDLLVRKAVEMDEPVPVRIALRVVLDALAGLQAVHDAADPTGMPLRILHRDVSPQNVLVGRDGTTRLADFGLAKCRGSQVVTDSKYVVGKLLYSAPEYLRHEQVGPELDIYALGVTLWTALAGFEPLPDHTEAQLLAHVLTEGIPRLDGDGGRIPPELVALVAKACATDAKNRFSSAAAMIDAIESLGRRADFVASTAEVSAFVDKVAGVALSMRRKKMASELERVRFSVKDPARTVTLRGAASAPQAREALAALAHRETERQSWTRVPSSKRTAPRSAPLLGTVLMVVAAALAVFGNYTSDKPRPITHASGPVKAAPRSEPFTDESMVTVLVAKAPAVAESKTSFVPSVHRTTARAPGKNVTPRRETEGGRLRSPALADNISVVNPYR